MVQNHIQWKVLQYSIPAMQTKNVGFWHLGCMTKGEEKKRKDRDKMEHQLLSAAGCQRYANAQNTFNT